MAKNDTQPHANYYPHRLCGAYARQTGKSCRAWAMANGRCRLHGGKSTGAKNPHKRITHGRRTKDAIARRKAENGVLYAARELLEDLG